eukprot:1147815-Pelagomonas_calceolata.AAC.4
MIQKLGTVKTMDKTLTTWTFVHCSCGQFEHMRASVIGQAERSTWSSAAPAIMPTRQATHTYTHKAVVQLSDPPGARPPPQCHGTAGASHEQAAAAQCDARAPLLAAQWQGQAKCQS